MLLTIEKLIATLSNIIGIRNGQTRAIRRFIEKYFVNTAFPNLLEYSFPYTFDDDHLIHAAILVEEVRSIILNNNCQNGSFSVSVRYYRDSGFVIATIIFNGIDDSMSLSDKLLTLSNLSQCLRELQAISKPEYMYSYDVLRSDLKECDSSIEKANDRVLAILNGGDPDKLGFAKYAELLM